MALAPSRPGVVERRLKHDAAGRGAKVTIELARSQMDQVVRAAAGAGSVATLLSSLTKNTHDMIEITAVKLRGAIAT